MMQVCEKNKKARPDGPRRTAVARLGPALVPVAVVARELRRSIAQLSSTRAAVIGEHRS
jgi:hypothetical protein